MNHIPGKSANEKNETVQWTILDPLTRPKGPLFRPLSDFPTDPG